MTMPMHVFGGTNYIRNDGHVPRILNLSSDFATNLVHNFYSNLSECPLITVVYHKIFWTKIPLFMLNCGLLTTKFYSSNFCKLTCKFSLSFVNLAFKRAILDVRKCLRSHLADPPSPLHSFSQSFGQPPLPPWLDYVVYEWPHIENFLSILKKKFHLNFLH